MSLLLPHISSFVLWVPSELVWVAARIQVVQGGTGGGTENGKSGVSAEQHLTSLPVPKGTALDTNQHPFFSYFDATTIPVTPTSPLP